MNKIVEFAKVIYAELVRTLTIEGLSSKIDEEKLKNQSMAMANELSSQLPSLVLQDLTDVLPLTRKHHGKITYFFIVKTLESRDWLQHQRELFLSRSKQNLIENNSEIPTQEWRDVFFKWNDIKGADYTLFGNPQDWKRHIEEINVVSIIDRIVNDWKNGGNLEDLCRSQTIRGGVR
jgi:hypothetical protein